MNTLGNDLEPTVAKQLLAQYLEKPGRFSDPYPMFRAIRAVEPVHWCEAAGIWVVLGHPEGRQAFLHDGLSNSEAYARLRARFRDPSPAAQYALQVWSSHPNTTDGAQHARLRPLMQHAFSPKAIRQWESTINSGIAELIASIRDRREFDLLQDFAARLPAMVVADILGVPREDHKLFVQWTDAWFNGINFTDQRQDYDSSLVRPIERFVEYIRALIDKRRADPASRSKGLVGFLLEAEESGDRLSETELIAAIMLIIIGGYETTANSISNGCLALLRNPKQLRRVKADPTLIAAAYEEGLRYESPARGQLRTATGDITIGGAQISKGQRLQVHPGAANRDGRVFERPDELDVTRIPNRHVAFGGGIHTCIGMHIARLEGRLALAAFANGIGELEIAGELQWRNAHVRGLTAFPVRRIRAPT